MATRPGVVSRHQGRHVFERLATATPLEVLTGIGTPVAGVAVAEYGDGVVHKTVLTLDAVAVALADEAGVVAYLSKKLYDFPAGVIKVVGAIADLAIAKSSVGVNANFDGDFSLGTAAAGNNATLTGTEQNLLPSTATPQAVAGATTAKGSSYAAPPAALTATALAGTANATLEALADIVGADAAAIVADVNTNLLPALRNNLADLAAKINELVAQAAGGVALILDGTATAIDAYLNMLVDDADHNVTATPCNLLFTGTVTLYWINLGDL